MSCIRHKAAKWDASRNDIDRNNGKVWGSVAGANSRNVWTINTQGRPDAHFATFPDELPRRCILAGTKEGDTVLDAFAGSGTTLAVAQALGRQSVGLDLNPEYLAIAAKRIGAVSLPMALDTKEPNP